MNKALFLLLSIFFLTACVDKENSNSGDLEMMSPLEESWSPMNESTKLSTDRSGRSMKASFSEDEAIETKIITTGSVTMEVVNITRFNDELKAIIAKYDATITNENSNDYDRRLESNYTIRVPKLAFKTFFDVLKPMAKKIESQSINAQDVTEQFIDIESRLKNRKALEERYREILKQAKNVNDILNIERQLNQIRSEIESQEGRLKYLNDQVDMSTIQLTAYQIKPYTYEAEEIDSFGQKIKQSIANGWSSLIGGIIWVISLWPLALIIVLVVILIKRRRKT
ncbi:MAG: flagellar biosynthesis chaperone FliJ [Roseivirga sp.]|jgi:flagellar biosynthesis chaperone FliJ